MRSKRTLAMVLAMSAALFAGGVSLAGAREAEPGDDHRPTTVVDDTQAPGTSDTTASTNTPASTDMGGEDHSTTTDDPATAGDGQHRGPDDHGRNRGPGGNDQADESTDGTTSTTVEDNPEPGDDDGVHQCRGCDEGADDGPDHDAAEDADHHGHDNTAADDHIGRDDGADDHSGRG